MTDLALPLVAFVGATVLGVVVAVSLGVLAWRRRPRPGATEFAVLSLVAAGWLAAHGGMLLAPGPDAARTWFLLSQAFLNYLPVPWLLFTLAYADVGPTIRRRLAVGLVGFATLGTAFILSHPWLGLGWDALAVVEASGLRYVVASYAGTGWLLAAGAFLTVGAGFGVLARLFVSSGRYHRRQIGLVAVAASFPTVATGVRILGVGPVPGFDFSPYAFVVESVVLFWALFGFDLLDLPPVGRAALFEQLSDPAFVLDATDRIVDGNGAARAVIGDGIVGCRLATVAPAVAAAVDTAAGPGDADRRTSAEIVLEVDGVDRHYDLRVEPLSAGYGRAGRLCLLNDVTERIARERTLEELASGTRRLVDAGDPAAVWRAAVEVARETADVTFVGGWARTDDVAEGGFDHVAGDAAVSPADLDVEPVATDGGHGAPVVIDGPDTPVDLDALLLVPVGDRGLLVVGDEDCGLDNATVRVADILATNLDVSLARVTRERELARQNARLEEFSAVLSHDLRNPLSVATGYVEALRSREGVAAERELDHVAGALDRIEIIIGGVLTLVGDADLDRRPMALRAVAASAWETTRTDDATIEYVGDDVVVEADRDWLQQALENLFRNAVEHGEAGVVRVGATDAGFFVEDDGVGLSTTVEDDLFERGVSGAGGTGIGMAVVRRVADVHGWEVAAADPTPDRGARFVFET